MPCNLSSGEPRPADPLAIILAYSASSRPMKDHSSKRVCVSPEPGDCPGFSLHMYTRMCTRKERGKGNSLKFIPRENYKA